MRGLPLAVVGALAAGSFPVLPKLINVQPWSGIPRDHGGLPSVPPPVVAWWLAAGAFAVALPYALVVPQVFGWWGLLSGALWAVSVTGRIAAIGLLNLCIASGVADVTTALTAFAFALLWLRESVRCVPLAAVGLGLFALAMGSLWVLEAQAHSRQRLLEELNNTQARPQARVAVAAGAREDAPADMQQWQDGEEHWQLHQQGLDMDGGGDWRLAAAETGEAAAAEAAAATAGAASGAADGLRQPLLGSLPRRPQHQQRHGAAPRHQEPNADGSAADAACPLSAAVKGQSPRVKYAVGTASALVAGICAGIAPLPLNMVPGHVGTRFLLCSALGVLLAASANVLAHRLLWHRSLLPDLRAREAARLGMAGGAVMLAANWCAIVAAQDPLLGHVTVGTVASTAVFVSGAWGVLLFKEIGGLLQVLFWFCGLELMGACAVVALSKQLAC
ncbi:hypothetical protein Rsub_06067 [Raphidocelis subcapitata]|uniref:EamA domain-containing protein n=1 Tax=Raphidocelis subcapitata TaxID=307507 RepID=A0A2V0P9G3_9CHLO|nr:hypothetical protein Rsub_06067 [Raphidocelis subcapitata]|eukprot:GBF93735.1 hypothetical protein Rsub_06067 [Raphidocelis subcapitata]